MMDFSDSFKNDVLSISKDPSVIEQSEIQYKYAGYIEREYSMVEEINKQEHMNIPERLDYSRIKSLSTEGRTKLEKVQPETIGQASRISGVSASDIAVLMVYLKN
jgi:tRNA uridine 5-carboxymethylaminomethyl modification enzyme